MKKYPIKWDFDSPMSTKERKVCRDRRRELKKDMEALCSKINKVTEELPVGIKGITSVANYPSVSCEITSYAEEEVVTVMAGCGFSDDTGGYVYLIFNLQHPEEYPIVDAYKEVTE